MKFHLTGHHSSDASDQQLLRASSWPWLQLLGTLLKILLVERGRFARICVEIDLRQLVVGKICVWDSWYEVAYEGLHAGTSYVAVVGVMGIFREIVQVRRGRIPTRLSEVKELTTLEMLKS